MKKHALSGCVLFFRPAPATLKQARQRQAALAIAFSIPTFEPWARKRMTLHVNMEQFHGTTILCVRRGKQVALGGDGQVTLGNIVMKGTARKVRKLYQGKVLVGFAGGTADAFTLLDRFEGKLEKHQGNLLRASVELAKDWRTDRVLRRLEAMLLVADSESTLVITGNGDVLEPEDGIGAIGSGGTYAQSAAKALQENTDLSPADVVRKSLTIAAELCIYTNMSHIIETLD
eukprot:gene18636-22300_t